MNSVILNKIWLSNNTYISMLCNKQIWTQMNLEILPALVHNKSDRFTYISLITREK